MDAQLSYKTVSANAGYFDVAVSGYDLASDTGLQTAVIISLFADRLANEDDTLPDGGDDRRGWWGDSLAEVDGDRIGSRLWLLAREKHLPSVAARARQYAAEALQWLVDDGIARDVVVTAEFVRMGVLGLGIEITRPDGRTLSVRYANLWEVLRAV